MQRVATVLALLVLLAGCAAPEHASRSLAPPQPRTVPELPAGSEPPGWPRACADVFDPDRLPTYSLEIAPDVLKTLEREHQTGHEHWYPAVFRFEAEPPREVMVRNRGNNSSCGTKMQLAIDFHRDDAGARFHGLRRVNLDHGDCKVLNERLALSVFHDAGIVAPCANSARLVINGGYYGLFTNLEPLDKEFLQRNFEEDEGNLWKSGSEQKTNESEGPGPTRIEDWRNPADLAELEEVADLEQVIAAWAVEAALPAEDNYWLHAWNYYVYEHPERGFVFVPVDLDQGTPRNTTTALDPLTAWHRVPELVLADPDHRARYIAALARARDAMHPDVIDARIVRWWEQIRMSAADDPFLDYEPGDAPSQSMRDAFRTRWQVLGERIACAEDPSACGP